MFRSDDSETRQNSYNVQLHASFMNLEYCLSISLGIYHRNSSNTIVMKTGIITPGMKFQDLYDIAWHACWEHEQRFGAVSLSDFVHTFYFTLSLFMESWLLALDFNNIKSYFTCILES